MKYEKDHHQFLVVTLFPHSGQFNEINLSEAGQHSLHNSLLQFGHLLRDGNTRLSLTVLPHLSHFTVGDKNKFGCCVVKFPYATEDPILVPEILTTPLLSKKKGELETLLLNISSLSFSISFSSFLIFSFILFWQFLVHHSVFLILHFLLFFYFFG